MKEMKDKMNNTNQEKQVRDLQYESTKEIELQNQKQDWLMYGVFGIHSVANFMVALCGANDYLRLRKTWNIVEVSNPIVVYITALTCAMLLNVSMIYFGLQYKSYCQKLCSRSEVTRVGIMSFTTFLIPYVFYALFTLATRNEAYSIKTNMGFQVGKGSEASGENSNAVLFIALYAVVLPLGTSFFSMLSGYFTSNPLQKRINRLRLKIIDIQNNIMDINQALKEAENYSIHLQYLKNCEIDKHNVFIENKNLQGLCLKIQVAELFAKRIDTPEAYSELITKTKGYIDNYIKERDVTHKSTDYIRDVLIKEGIDYDLINDVIGNNSVNNPDTSIDSVIEGRRSLIYGQ